MTTKISFANYLGILSKKIDPEINIDNVTTTIGLDKESEINFFKAGGPYGGTCFPRDTWAFEKISQKVGLTSGHMLANEDINKKIISNIYNDLLSNNPSKIGLIGLGFKPRTTVITEGTACQLMSLLYKFKGEIHLYDHLSECIDNFKIKFKDFKNFVFHKTCKTLLNSVEVSVYCNDDQLMMIPQMI